MQMTGLAASLAAGVLMIAPQIASAQQSQNCAPRDHVIARLASGYGEVRQSIGLGSNNAVIETYASPETGSWTITVTMPGGMTCLVASGQAFERVTDTLPDGGNDT